MVILPEHAESDISITELLAEMQMKIFTIGYEGRDFEEYLRLLEEHAVRIVVDVRRDPVSRKPGFSKRRMSELLAEAGISYEHVPELGIAKARRFSVRTREDSEKLLRWYREEVLEQEHGALKKLMRFLDEFQQVALTCYEADPDRCHRKLVAEKLVDLRSGKIECMHL